jgi:hypothetical protein
MMPAAELIPSKPNGAKSDRLSASPARHPDDDEQQEHGALDDHHDGVDLGRFAGTANEQQGAHHDQDHRGQVEDAILLRRVRQVGGDRPPEDVVEQLVQVLRPADRDRGGRHAVLEQQTRRHDDRDPLAQRGVRVRVGGAGDRHRASQLGVTDRGEACHRPGEDERQDGRGPADRNRLRQDDEDARCRSWLPPRTRSAGTVRSNVAALPFRCRPPSPPS